MVESNKSSGKPAKKYNNRYIKVKEVGQGSFGHVILCIDTLPSQQGRKISQEHLDLLKAFDTDAPANEWEREENMTPEKKQAIEVLGNNQILFPDNDKFANVEAEPEQNHKFVAVKKTKLNAYNDKDGIPFYVLTEIRMFQELNHVNVTKLYDVFYAQDGSICVVMEYYQHSLYDMVRKQPAWEVLQPTHIKNILQQLVQAIAYIHEQGLIHRDIKPDNMLFDESGTLKLIDFGIAKKHKPGMQHTKNVVTRCYRAPELFFGCRKYDTSLDIWSLGCTVGELFQQQKVSNKSEQEASENQYFKNVLFPGTSDLNQLSEIFDIMGTPDEEKWPELLNYDCYIPFHKKEPVNLSQLFPKATVQEIDLIQKMLQLNPIDRITAQDTLNHDYFKTEPIACKNEELPFLVANNQQ